MGLTRVQARFWFRHRRQDCGHHVILPHCFSQRASDFSQVATTNRYANLTNDDLRAAAGRFSNVIEMTKRQPDDGDGVRSRSAERSKLCSENLVLNGTNPRCSPHYGVKAFILAFILRRTVMKRITATALLTLAALVPAGGAMAQGRAVRATVPFDFSVGDKLLPAGNYEISEPSYGVIEVRNRDEHVTMLTSTRHDSHQSRNGNKLVFHKYGDQYFLSEILCASSDINVSLAPAKAEKQARTMQAAMDNPAKVYIAAR